MRGKPPPIQAKLRNSKFEIRGITKLAIKLQRQIAELRTTRRPHWHIVGDSHCHAIALGLQNSSADHPVLSTIVGGATAVGLRNPNSKTNAVQTFLEALKSSNRNKTIIIQLGEVDCGFVIWFRAKKYGDSIEKQFEESCEAYAKFVDQLLQLGHKKIILTAATLPTILDGQDWGDVANIRREVTASLRKRTDLTLEYNQRLKRIASDRELPFIDLSEITLNSSTRLVDDKFRNPDPADHHLDPEKIAPLWAQEIERFDF